MSEQQEVIAAIYMGKHIPETARGAPDKRGTEEVYQLQLRGTVITHKIFPGEGPADKLPQIAAAFVTNLLEEGVGRYKVYEGETILDPLSGQEIVVGSLPTTRLTRLRNIFGSAGLEEVTD